jgi:endonuclease YncB( thermonuclease family)
MNPARFFLVGLISVTAAAMFWRSGGAVEPAMMGEVVVVDGDSLRIGEYAVRLAGIDAPELGQSCTGPGNIEWECGREARRELARQIDAKPVSCRDITIDEYDRIVATCTSASGADLSAGMVRSGYALADGRAPRYVEDEASARVAGKGMWAGSFQTPWEWRAERLEPDDCC